MYLVAWEAEDGSWQDNPEGFDTLAQAEYYAAKMVDALLDGNAIVIYSCREVKTIEKPQIVETQDS